MEQGKKEVSFSVVKNISKGDLLVQTFYDFGKTLPFEKAQNCLLMISSEENQSAVINGMSERINDQMESNSVNPYVYNYSEYTQYLSNILFHQAKIACFFEEERNEEKLDILSEVLDIKDWRRISA